MSGKVYFLSLFLFLLLAIFFFVKKSSMKNKNKERFVISKYKPVLNVLKLR